MDEQQLTAVEMRPNKLAFRVALGFSVYTLVLIYLFKLLNIDTRAEHLDTLTKLTSAVFSYVPFILGIMYVQQTYRTELGGYISFGSAFSAGFKVGAYAGLFIGLLMVLYYKVLDRAAMDQMINLARENAGDNEKNLQALKVMEPYMVIFTAFGAAITYTLFGLVISLVGAAIVKREKPFYADRTDAV